MKDLMCLNVVTSSFDIDELCTKEMYYTRKEPGEYDELLEYVDDHRQLNEDSLNWIAQNIFKHTPGGEIDDIKYYILNEACTFFTKES